MVYFHNGDGTQDAKGQGISFSILSPQEEFNSLDKI